MTAHGRNIWLCGNAKCRARLAVVRGEYPKRRLTVCLGVPPAQHREDGSLVIHCPRCGMDNRFEWRKPGRG